MSQRPRTVRPRPSWGVLAAATWAAALVVGLWDVFARAELGAIVLDPGGALTAAAGMVRTVVLSVGL